MTEMRQRKREMALLLSGLLLLAACSAPGAETPIPTPSPTPEVTPAPEHTEEVKELWGFPIDDTHDAFEVPTGGKLGNVLVTVDIETGDYHFSVWKSGDLENPIQTMEAESFGLFRQSNIVDANFDGYMDFSYIYSRGNQPIYGYYWIWDEENGLFENEPEFNTISDPSFDEETEIISGYAYSSVASGTHSYYRWEDGKLICVRQVEVCYPEEDWTSQQLVVRDRINGKLTEVYRETFGSPNESERIYEEAEKWQDLSYHGEDAETLWGFPIDDTHDAFEVPTGGRLGTVLVTVEIGEEGEHQFSVWTKDDLATPLQTMTGEGTRVATWHDIADVDFDGYMDFGYVRQVAPHTLYFNYWLWDEDKSQFVMGPQLAEIAEPQFDQSTKTIFERYFTWNYSNDSIYKWQGTELVCARKITVSRVYDEKGVWLDQYEWTVQALVENELVEIHRETVTVSEDSFFTLDNIEDTWYDLDYYGE